MQQPTLTNVRIRSTSDAHRIFHAVQKGHLERIKRRLDAEEREALGSGCIYVWEERGSHTVDVTGLGIERFTEGKRWTASRVRDEFLFYYQIKPNDAPDEWDQLIKQTYSAWVNKREGRRKWHLTAYFTERTVNDLQTIDDIPTLSHLSPPAGQYQSARVANRRPQASRKRSDASKRTAIDRTFAPFTNQSSSEPVKMHNPYNAPALPHSNIQTSQATAPLPAPTSLQHSHNIHPSPATPSPYVNAHNANDVHMPKSPATAPEGETYPNPTWRGGPIPAYLYSAPETTGLSTPRTISLPPVHMMYDEEQLFPLSSHGSSPARVAYGTPYPLEASSSMEPSYELASPQDDNDSDGSKDSQALGLALAPMHDLERRRYVYRRDYLDDRALRSFL
ncbi:hypothetical protein H0H87_009334 [Tephrocybe sp. NHM501043]|nr:hypothetical protein H0H87_009334 [Tephrocybe sp. NHM501043]